MRPSKVILLIGLVLCAGVWLQLRSVYRWIGEPHTFLLAGSGLCLFGLLARRRPCRNQDPPRGSHIELAGHIVDGDLERYLLDKITAEAELAPLEEHLLVCHACIDRAESMRLSLAAPSPRERG